MNVQNPPDPNGTPVSVLPTSPQSPQPETYVPQLSAVTPLFNNNLKPQYERQKETEQHRVIAALRANGLTYTEIGKRMGLSRPTVSDICKLPWVRERVLRLIEETGRKVLEERLSIEADDSLDVILEIRDDASVNPDTRARCAFGLIERKLGKATQRIEQRNVGPITADDVADLDTQLQKVQEELARRTSAGGTQPGGAAQSQAPNPSTPETGTG